MAALQSHLLQLCPVNVLRPTFPPAVTGAAREALIDIYNDALWRNPDGFRRAMQAVYSLEPAVAPTSLDFDAMAAFDAAQLSSSRLSLHSLLQLNLHGCVWRTTRGLYAALQGSFQGVDGDSRSTWTAALFSVLLSLSAAVSCFRLSSSYWLQSAYSIAILLLYNTSFVFTQFGERIVALAAAHLFTVVLLRYAARSKPPQPQDAETSTSFARYMLVHRGYFMVATIIVILAYDNLHFNRLCSKTFYSGFSAMDIGCGFMIAHSGAMKSMSSQKHNRGFLSIIRRQWGPLLLGVLRLLTTAAVDYHVPVEEYGVHWNFFLSLGLTKLLAECILAALPERLLIAVPVSIAVVYEGLIWAFDAVHTIPALSRTNLLTANKEGIMAIPNSVSLFFIGYCTTRACAKRYQEKGRGNALLYLCGIVSAAIGASFCLYLLGIPSSRSLVNFRFLMNITYTFFGVFITVLAAGAVFGESADFAAAEAVGKHSFEFFLLANALTGAVNILGQPLLLPLWVMFPLVLAYGAVCCCAAVAMERRNVKLL